MYPEYSLPLHQDARRCRPTREKVVVSQRRYERACKRIADANMPFHERGGTTARVTDFSAKKIGTQQSPFRRGDSKGIRTPVAGVRGRSLNRLTMEPKLVAVTGFEPVTLRV